MILRMALRNLIRRPMQSFLASGAVAGGLTLILWTTNFQDGAWVLFPQHRYSVQARRSRRIA